jgi:hypothetical protein
MLVSKEQRDQLTAHQYTLLVSLEGITNHRGYAIDTLQLLADMIDEYDEHVRQTTPAHLVPRWSSTPSTTRPPSQYSFRDRATVDLAGTIIPIEEES